MAQKSVQDNFSSAASIWAYLKEKYIIDNFVKYYSSNIS